MTALGEVRNVHTGELKAIHGRGAISFSIDNVDYNTTVYSLVFFFQLLFVMGFKLITSMETISTIMLVIWTTVLLKLKIAEGGTLVGKKRRVRTFFVHA